MGASAGLAGWFDGFLASVEQAKLRAARARVQTRDVTEGKNERAGPGIPTNGEFLGESPNERLSIERPSNERLTNERLTNERPGNERLTNERPSNERLNNERLNNRKTISAA
jgi:hypothetical protein